MRIGLLSSWASRANGGVFEAVAAQAAMLRGLGAVPVVLALEDPDHAADRWRLGDAEVVTVPGKGPRRLAYAPGLADALEAARLDILHLHGIWHYPTHAAGAWARRTGRPLVISPHGMLAPWILANNPARKRIARHVWERRGWRSARLLHALTEAEAADIADSLPGAPVTVIANAAPPPGPPPQPRGPALLYIGRIHEKKNLAALVEGWTRVRPHLPADATLTIAGWGDDDGVATLEARLAGCDPSVEFVGAAFGSQKAALLDFARFVILPSFSEGLPMAILEAWAAGVPTIQTAECNLPEGLAGGAALSCGTDPASIAEAILDALGRSAGEWTRMSAAAQALANGAFSAARIGGQWEGAYARLLSGDGAA